VVTPVVPSSTPYKGGTSEPESIEIEIANKRISCRGGGKFERLRPKKYLSGRKL